MKDSYPAPDQAPSTIGQEAEHQAERLLVRHGLQLVSRNFRCRGGEIDLIMYDAARTCLVFVEVRARSRQRWGSAAMTIDERKQRRLRHAAEMFLKRNPAMARYRCRFDAVCIDNDQPEWIRQAFDG